MQLHLLIETLVRADIDVVICRLSTDIKDAVPGAGEFGYRLDGFGKSGSVTLVPGPSEFVAVDRYRKVTEIYQLSDLLLLNLEWAEITARRNNSDLAPDARWKDLLIEHGMLEVTQKPVYTVKP